MKNDKGKVTKVVHRWHKNKLQSNLSSATGCCSITFVFLVFVELIPVAVKVRHPRMETLLRQV
jgi:CBS domain containing-hemolysin-like protein